MHRLPFSLLDHLLVIQTPASEMETSSLYQDLIFFDKGNILISRDTNYIQPLQQRNTLMAVWIHTAKRKKKLRKNTRYCIPVLTTIIRSPPRQQLNSNSAQAPSSPDQRS
jgi:hypothetical protein